MNAVTIATSAISILSSMNPHIGSYLFTALSHCVMGMNIAEVQFIRFLKSVLTENIAVYGYPPQLQEYKRKQELTLNSYATGMPLLEKSIESKRAVIMRNSVILGALTIFCLLFLFRIIMQKRPIKDFWDSLHDLAEVGDNMQKRRSYLKGLLRRKSTIQAAPEFSVVQPRGTVKKTPVGMATETQEGHRTKRSDKSSSKSSPKSSPQTSSIWSPRKN